MIRQSVLGFALAVLAAGALAGTLPAQPAKKAGATFGKPAVSGVIFDQGPSTGTYGGCWSNFTLGQNFSDPAPLAAGTSVTGITIFTCIPPVTGTVTFKAVDENSHAFLYTESGTPSSWVDDGSGGYIVTYTLANPFVVPGGASVGYGLSGDGFELGQNSVLSPGDGLMSQYSGSEFSFLTSVGDQTFQLLGGSKCDVDGDGSYTSADLIAFLKECRRTGGHHCFVKMIKLARQCGTPAD